MNGDGGEFKPFNQRTDGRRGGRDNNDNDDDDVRSASLIIYF